MRIRDYLEQASTRGVPDWLVRESPSREGDSLTDEWKRHLTDPKSNDAQRRLATGMLQLRAEQPVRSLLGAANTRALRWADSAANRSRLAQQLRQAAPSANRWPRVLARMRSAGWRITAGLTVVFVRIGLFSAIDGVLGIFRSGRRESIDRDQWPRG